MNKPLRERVDTFLENYHYVTLSKQDLLDIKVGFLNLIKEELDGLTVMDVKCHCERLYKECHCHCDDCNYVKNVKQAYEAQLSHTIKELTEKL